MQKEVVSVLDYWQAIAMVFVWGGFGGMVSAVFDNFDSENDGGKSRHACSKCNSAFFFRRALIGVAGTFCALYLAMWLKKLTLENDIGNIFYLSSFCVAAGVVSIKILPQLSKKIGEQVLNDKIEKASERINKTEERISETINQLELSLKNSQNAVEYSSAIAAAETAMARGTKYNDIPDAIAKMIAIKQIFPKDRLVHLYLGRLYRRNGELNKAITILREFIRIIEAEGEQSLPNSNVDKSDAYFNIACYHSLKAAAAKESGESEEEVDRLTREALEALSTSLFIWDENKKFAQRDPDLLFIKENPKYAELVNSDGIASNKPEPC